MRAGLNPVDMLKHFGKRIKLIHQKDFAWDSLAPINLNGLTPEDIASSAFAEIGTGIMPIQSIIDAANTYTDAGYIILEQDFTRMSSEIDSVAKSMEAFKKFTGGNFSYFKIQLLSLQSYMMLDFLRGFLTFAFKLKSIVI